MRTLNFEAAKKKGALAAFLVAGALVVSPVAQAQPNAQGRTGTMVWKRDNKSETAKAWQKGAKVRFEWVSPVTKKGDFMIDDGTTVSLYHKGENTVTQTNSRGRILKLTHLQNAQNVNIPDSKFEFVTPQGAKVLKIDGKLYSSLPAAKRAADWFLTPQPLPDGYVFENAIVGTDKVWQRFSDGKQMFSLFQQKNAGEGEVKPQPVKGRPGLFWKRGGIRFWLTGAPNSIANAVATSVK